MDPTLTKQTFDAIIVGSGAGGAAAAWALARAGLAVLLLEKGGELPADGSTLDLRTVIHDGRYLSRETWRDGRGRPFAPEEHFNVGGKTRWYGAALLRYGAHEFAADPSHQCRGWPVTIDTLAPWYAQVEHRLGVREFECEPDLRRLLARMMRSSDRWHAAPLPMGLDPRILDDDLEARHFDGFASVAGLKNDAQRAFLDPIIDRPNFRLLDSAEVAELVADSVAPARVAGVQLADGRILRARTVLLAAGALHSPRLLQRFIERHALAGSLPGAASIGRNLKLHLLTAMVAVSPSRKRDLLRKTTLLLHDDLPRSSVQPLGFDGELIATLMPAAMPARLARRIGDRAYGFFLQTEDGSHPDNRVRETTDGRGRRVGDPVLDYDDRRLPHARAEHGALVWRLTAALARAGALAFSRRIGVAGTAHACGTLIAGADPASSVVAGNGGVHGLDGLYVVDGSVLPRSSRVNPSLTIFAWSLHVADQLARTLRAEPGACAAAHTVARA
ncbi:MAG: GMC family oxidoreductase [Gammaproteobacteria bacterium]|nr:GMC family oxidoreductase [Gammaproteobacteria bacterium]